MATSEDSESPPLEDCREGSLLSREEGKCAPILVMDIVKRETLTTQMKLVRDKGGKVHYTAHKQVHIQTCGIVDESASLQERLRQDSFAVDFMPAECFGKMSVFQANLAFPTKPRQTERKNQHGRSQSGKKTMERVHEKTKATWCNEEFTESLPTEKESKMGASRCPLQITASSIPLSIARRSLICLAPKPIQFEILSPDEVISEQQSSAHTNVPPTSQNLYERLQLELKRERATNQKKDDTRLAVEKENKKLKSQLEKVEATHEAQIRQLSAHFQRQMATLEANVNIETKKRVSAQESLRQLESHLTERAVRLEEAMRRSGESEAKVALSDSRLSELQRQVNELTEECFHLRARRRQAEGEVEQVKGINESLARENAMLKSKWK